MHFIGLTSTVDPHKSECSDNLNGYQEGILINA